MARSHSASLAASVLNDREIVTYRSLSHALNIHYNTAKKILFDFYTEQNSKQARSVHATYLVLGLKRREAEAEAEAEAALASTSKIDADGDDVHMHSSPYMSSSMAPAGMQTSAATQTMTLVKEENLEELKGEYAVIFSIHVYSIEPSTLQNIQVLSDVSRAASDAVSTTTASEASYYGAICCSYVKRRGGILSSEAAKEISRSSKGPSIPDVPSNKHASEKADQADEVIGETITSARKAADESLQSQKAKSQELKRDRPNLLTAFAKTKAKSSTAANTAPRAGPPKSPADTEQDGKWTEFQADPKLSVQVEMQLSCEDEPISDTQTQSTMHTASFQHKKKQREEKLRKMMEDEDEPLVESEVQSDQDHLSITTSTGNAVVEQSSVDSQPSGRKRGRRRIVKRTTTKDTEGFLVTREEPIWESYSEEELPAPSKPKSSAPSKSKKASGKGSGNIMSFFGRK